MTKKRLFRISFLVGMVGTLALFFFDRPPARPRLVPIASSVFLTSQLEPKTVPLLKRHDIRTIVDLRPDGEEFGQPTAAQMELASKNNEMNFHYIPVPHENIPDSAVSGLRDVLSHKKEGNIVLYCRTGRRAVRTFALAEASREDGLPEEEILRAIEIAGVPADDLKSEITERILHRNPHSTEKK